MNFPDNARPNPAGAPVMRQSTVVTALTLLLGIQPVTTDLYLPALPTLARSLNAAPGAAQLTLSALIICFGVAQLVWGPLADRYGRRPVLLAGLALYVVAAVGAALAPAIDWLIAWRALQGAGMAAAVTCGRSVIRDLFEPREGARVMSRALGGLGLLAMTSPMIGGFLVQTVHWRATLAAVALFGAAALAFIALRFVETLPRPDPRGTELLRIAANWRRILAHPTFIAWAALLCASWGGLFAMLASSSFVYIEVLGASRQACGAMLASSSVAYIGGTLLCRRLLAQGNASRAAAIGAVFSVTGGALLAGVSLAGAASLATLLPGLWLYGIGHGVSQPCGQAGVTSPFPDSAGTAASLSGFLMMVTAFGVGLLLTAVMNGTVFPLTLTMGGFGTAVATVAWTLVRVHGDRRVLAPTVQAA
jgi:MFS transporter, DHA1 family, multidrug resistance protein